MPASTPRPPHVLVVEPDDARAEHWTAALDAAGAVVHRARDLAGALRAPLVERALIAWELPDGCGLDLVSELRARVPELAAVLTAVQPDHATTRAAWHAGALDLCDADERPGEALDRLLAPAPASGATSPADPDLLELRAEHTGPDAALRELGALALRRGFSPAARARLLTAAAEALDNAARHAYPEGRGPVDLTARAHAGGLWVAVRDRGRGCRASDAELDSTAAALPGRATPGGLARMRALVEGFRFDSAPDAGATVELLVRDHGTALDGGTDTDLSDLDYLTPTRARRLLLELADPHRAQALTLPPALSALAGRLAACASDDRRARRALWS